MYFSLLNICSGSSKVHQGNWCPPSIGTTRVSSAYEVTSFPGAAPQAVKRGASFCLQRNPNSTFCTPWVCTTSYPNIWFSVVCRNKSKIPCHVNFISDDFIWQSSLFLDDFILQRKVFSPVRWLSWWRYLPLSLRNWVPQDPHGRRRIKSQSHASCSVTSAHVLWNVPLSQMSELVNEYNKKLKKGCYSIPWWLLILTLTLEHAGKALGKTQPPTFTFPSTVESHNLVRLSGDSGPQ